MQGQVLQVDGGRQSGLILGDDGVRYEFVFAEWKAATAPVVGASVDYLAAAGFARAIYPLPEPGVARQPDPMPVAAGSNAPLLGGLGVFFLVVGFVVPVLPTIAAFVLGLIGADAAKRTPERAGLALSRIAWIGAVLVLIGWALLIGLGFGLLVAVLHEVTRGGFGTAAGLWA